jgi:hypothetical protein
MRIAGSRWVLASKNNFLLMERRRGQASVYKLEQQQKEKAEAIELYRQGYSLREVAHMKGHSRGWVWKAVHEFDKSPDEKTHEEVSV